MITDAALKTVDEFPFYGNFAVTHVGSYDFWVHNEAKLYTFETHGVTYFLIGHAYNPYSMEYLEIDILKSLSEADAQGQYFEKLSELTGIFAVGIVSEQALTVVSDASGMQYICYAKVKENVYISSHMRLIGDLCALPTDDFVKKLIHYRWYKYLMGNYLPGDLACCKEIKRIIPNTYLQYKDSIFSVTRFYPTKELDMCQSEEAYQAVIKEAAQILQNTMRLIPMKWERPSISLTGGIDSNTTFAAIAPDYHKYTAFSYVAMEREAIDAEKARQISDAFGVKHTTYTIPDDNASIEDFEVYKAILQHNEGDIGSTKDNDTRKKIYLMQHDVCDVEIKSWISETIRAYAYKYFGKKKFRKSLTPRDYTSLYKIFFANRSLVWQSDRHYRDYLEMTQLKQHLFNYDETDFFVWEHMHGGKCGLNIGVMKSCFDITIPYNNRKLLDLLLRVPLAYRINDRHHMDLKRLMNQKLYDMDIRVVNANQSEKRAKLLGAYFTIHSHLPF